MRYTIMLALVLGVSSCGGGNGGPGPVATPTMHYGLPPGATPTWATKQIVQTDATGHYVIQVPRQVPTGEVTP
jgi:hypothetical protein